MSNLEIYCVTNKKLSFLENTTLKLAAVGKDIFSDRYLKCDNKINIYDREKYYSELTFHYWYWKNCLNDSKKDWIGFCQKRRFWIKENSKGHKISKENLIEHLLTEIPQDLSSYESFLCEPIYVNKVKKIKMLKKGFKSLLKNPLIFFNSEIQSLKFHFDMHHGDGNLNKAIGCLNNNDREDFREYMFKNVSFHPHIMFITKPNIAEKWFSDLFSWLFECEKIFGFKDLVGYEKKRLYAFLAERYLSFWFNKYCKIKNSPWIFYDTTLNV